MFVFNRAAVRELRRQLARVVALLSDDNERVARLVSYVRREQQATIGNGGNGGGATTSKEDFQSSSSSSVKNEAKQAATTATSTTTTLNTDNESMQLSAADCGEWLVGRVLSALLLLADDKNNEKNNNNNNNDDDDANNDDGEKKATNEVRELLLAAGVDEATVEQTVKGLNWKTIRSKLLESSNNNNNNNNNEEEEEYFVIDLVPIDNDNNNNKATNSTTLTTANAADVVLLKVKTIKQLRMLFRVPFESKLVLMNLPKSTMILLNGDFPRESMKYLQATLAKHCAPVDATVVQKLFSGSFEFEKDFIIQILMSQIAGNDQGNQFVLVVVLPPSGLSTLSATRRIELARALRSLTARARQATSLTVACESEENIVSQHNVKELTIELPKHLIASEFDSINAGEETKLFCQLIDELQSSTQHSNLFILHLTGDANNSHPMSFHKLAVALTDQLMQAAAANRENESKRENTSMQSMMCVRLFIENEHDTQQLTTTRRWSPLCGWNVIAVSIPLGADCYDYLYLPTCVYLMLSALITLSGGNRQLWQAFILHRIQTFPDETAKLEKLMKLNIVEVIAFDCVALFNTAMQRQIEIYFDSNIVKAAPLANRKALREWIYKRISMMMNVQTNLSTQVAVVTKSSSSSSSSSSSNNNSTNDKPLAIEAPPSTSSSSSTTNNKKSNKIKVTRRDPNINKPVDKHGNTPLIVAALLGKLGEVKQLISHGANINVADNNGNTALHCAVEKGHVAVAALLLDNDANIEARNKNGDTPLIHAAFHGQLSCVALLLDRSAKIDAVHCAQRGGARRSSRHRRTARQARRQHGTRHHQHRPGTIDGGCWQESRRRRSLSARQWRQDGRQG